MFVHQDKRTGNHCSSGYVDLCILDMETVNTV
jgi:hypothetical protein